MAFKRKDTGKWKETISVYTSDGRRHRVSIEAESKKELKDKVALKRLELSKTPAQTMTFGECAALYLEYAKTLRKMTTLRDTEKNLNNHVLPTFRNSRMSAITWQEIDSWKRLKSSEISPRTGKKYSLQSLLNMYKALCVVFAYARVHYGIMNDCLKVATNFKRNPNDIVEKPPLHYWTISQYEAFRESCVSLSTSPIHDGYILLFDILFYAGLRRGEANALKVTDFHDGSFPYLDVTKTCSEKIKGYRQVITAPKTKCSVREVPIPDILAKRIRKHIELLKSMDGYTSEFFLCGGLDPTRDTTVDLFKQKAEAKADVPHIRIHDLRHSYATMAINAGASPFVLKQLLGHESIDLIMKVYGHLYPKTLNTVVNSINMQFQKGENSYGKSH